MNTSVSLLLTALVASGVGAGSALVLSPVSTVAPTETTAIEPDRIEGLTRSIEELRAAQVDLGARLAERPELAGPARLDLAQVESMVARMLEERGEAGTVRPASVSTATGKLSSEERFAALFEKDGDDLEALWKELVEEGLEDEALAWFEAQAEGAPGNVDAQYQLGQAYLMKLQGLGSSPEAGRVATLADQSFDRVLELDDHHWDARFTKAVALSFWPPIFGKQADAVKQFEVLVNQQSSSTPQPGFAQTHLLLGNLYQQLGQADKAKSAWQTGATLFPDSESLQGKVQDNH